MTVEEKNITEISMDSKWISFCCTGSTRQIHKMNRLIAIIYSTASQNKLCRRNHY